MKVDITKAKWNVDADGTWLSVRVPSVADAKGIVDGMQEDKTYTVEVKRKTKKRSLSQNNYSWMLTDKLAEVMLVAGVPLSKDEMHAEMIFRYGQVETDRDGNQVWWSTKQNVNVAEFYPYAKECGESELNGETFTHYRIYRGSHTYDTHEMQMFITGIVEECKQQGIPTETPEEIARWNLI